MTDLRYRAPGRVVAIGDLHGRYDCLLKLVLDAGLAVPSDDGRLLDWIGEDAHLVQTGDFLDRGPDDRRVMDALIRLQEQAATAGGQVHVLIGNHEVLNLQGDYDFVSADSYAAWVDERSVSERDRLFARLHGDASNKARRRRFNSEHPLLGFVERVDSLDEHGVYGQWIRGLPTAIVVNDTLFVHAGIGPEWRDTSLTDISRAVRAELDLDSVCNPYDRTKATSYHGPVWFYGLHAGIEARPVTTGYVTRLLTRHQAARICVGHVVSHTITTAHGGRVICIDTGMTWGGPVACLVIDAGREPYMLVDSQVLPLGTRRTVGGMF